MEMYELYSQVQNLTRSNQELVNQIGFLNYQNDQLRQEVADLKRMVGYLIEIQQNKKEEQ